MSVSDTAKGATYKVSDKMPSEKYFSMYNQRLRKIVAGTKANPDTELTIQCKMDLDAHSLDELVDGVAGVTLS